MPSFDLYKKINSATSIGKAHKQESDMVMEATWESDINTRVCYLYDYFRHAVCGFGRSIDCVYGADSNRRSIYRMCGGSVPDFDGESGKGIGFCDYVLSVTTIRRKLYLSSCSREFCRPSVDMGISCGKCRRQSYGSYRNVNFHSTYGSRIYITSGNCEPKVRIKRIGNDFQHTLLERTKRNNVC